MSGRILLVVVAAGLALAGCQDKPKEAAAPARPVLIKTVAFEPRVPERSFVATIRPRTESDLGFRVGGKVLRRLVDTGQRVKLGQPLAELDPADLQLQLEQAQAEAGAARAAVEQTKAELGRAASLIEKGWSTPAALDRQKAAAEEAAGRLTRAERALVLAGNALSYAVLTANADGVVTATQVEPGQVVAAGQSAIRIARLDQKEAVVAVPENQVGAIREGEASATLWSAPGKVYQARLRELSPSADAATRTYLARYALPEAGSEVELGMTATVVVGARSTDRVARLPLSSLYNQGQGPAVWVVDNEGKPALRPVTVAAYEAQDVLVSAGLSDGERVVALGVQKLEAGRPVRVVSALQF